MPFFVYATMLSSQLIVMVADRVPQFDVGPTCRESTVPDCTSMENIARDNHQGLADLRSARQGKVRHGRKDVRAAELRRVADLP